MTKRSKGISWFVGITYAITWGTILIIYLLQIPLPDPGNPVPDPVLILIGLPASFGPAIAAIVVRKWITREGFNDAGLSLNLKSGWKFYLVALLYPLVVIPIAVGIAAAVEFTSLDFSALSLAAVLTMFVGSLFSTLIFWGEEFGWRGYLQVRIAPGKPLLAAILTGLIWGIWHFPFVISGMSFSGNPVALLIYPVDAALLSIFYGWLRTKSKSVWPVSLAHAAGNVVVTNVLAMILPGVPQLLTWGGFTLGSYAVLALVLVLSRQVKWRDAQPGEVMDQS